MPHHPHDLTAGDDYQKHDADGEIQVLRAHLEAQGQAESQHADHQRSQGCTDDGAFAAGGERPSQHDGGDDGKRIGRPQIILGRVQLRGQQGTGDGGTDTGQHVGAHDYPAGVDAGVFGCLLIDTHKENAASVLGFMQQDVHNDDEQNIDHNLHRQFQVTEELRIAEPAER